MEVSSNYEVELVDYSKHGTTGHIHVIVCAVEDKDGATMRGPIRAYGIDATQLKVLYNSDILQWMQFVKREHQAHHGLHTVSLDALKAMKGKRI